MYDKLTTKFVIKFNNNLVYFMSYKYQIKECIIFNQKKGVYHINMIWIDNILG